VKHPLLPILATDMLVAVEGARRDDRFRTDMLQISTMATTSAWWTAATTRSGSHSTVRPAPSRWLLRRWAS